MLCNQGVESTGPASSDLEFLWKYRVDNEVVLSFRKGLCSKFSIRFSMSVSRCDENSLCLAVI